MISKHHAALVPHLSHLSQHLEGIWAAIYQVPSQPKLIAILQVDLLDQRFKLPPTTLNVTYCVYGHLF
jgi:hypothetical protein